LKLGLKYAADALAKPSHRTGTLAAARTPPSFKALTVLNKSTKDMIHGAMAAAHTKGLLAGRQALVSGDSCCLSDCAELSAESTVLDIAMRPIASF
jgi:hypothetical protein